MASPSDEIVDLILRLLVVKEMREGPIAEALGAPLRRVQIASPNESFAGELPAGPLEKVQFRVNKETDGAIVTMEPRSGSPSLFEGQLDFARLGKKPTAFDMNPHIPPEGTSTLIYGPLEKRALLRFTATTKKFLGVAIHWEARR